MKAEAELQAAKQQAEAELQAAKQQAEAELEAAKRQAEAELQAAKDAAKLAEEELARQQIQSAPILEEPVEPEPEPQDFGKKEIPDLPPPQGGATLQPVGGDGGANPTVKIIVAVVSILAIGSGLFLFL